MPSRPEDSGLYPLETTDSHFGVHRYGVDILRGSGDRLVGYFRIDPRSSTAGSSHQVSIEFLDEGTGSWAIEFIPTEAEPDAPYPWRMTRRINLDNSKNWSQAEIQIDRARLTGANDNADFRIVVVDPEIERFRIRSISVRVKEKDVIPPARGFVLPSPYLTVEFPTVAEPGVSIVIPVFNRVEYTVDCLRAIMEFTPPIYQVIVVDNGSTDATAERLGEISGLRVVTSGNNLGFSKGCNLGAKHSRSPWLVFLNNDTIPQPGWLTAMLALAENMSRVGVVGCKMIFPQTGEVQHAGVSFGKYLLPVEDFQYYDPNDPEVCCDREVVAVTGACMLTPKPLFDQLGGFDEDFLNGLEDTDYCLRAQQDNRRVMYCSASCVLHYKSVTEGRVNLHHHKRNVSLFQKKWHEHILSTYGDPDRRVLFKAGLPLEWTMDAQGIGSQTGELVGSNIVCHMKLHASGHCVFGPYVEVGERITMRVTFSIQHSSHHDPGEKLVSLDVYDSVNDATLVYVTIRVKTGDHGEDLFSLEFIGQRGQILEFRVYWHAKCDIRISRIKLEANEWSPHSNDPRPQ